MWKSLMLLSGVLILSASSVNAEYIFYEGNGGSQNLVCTLPQGILSANFKNDPYGCDNDEARSVVLADLPTGAILTVYDDPGCGTGDDYTRIRVLQGFSGTITISSFEGGSYPSNIQFSHFHNNGLDGKVSCARISRCGDGLCSAGESCAVCAADCCP